MINADELREKLKNTALAMLEERIAELEAENKRLREILETYERGA